MSAVWSVVTGFKGSWIIIGRPKVVVIHILSRTLSKSTRLLLAVINQALSVFSLRREEDLVLVEGRAPEASLGRVFT